MISDLGRLTPLAEPLAAKEVPTTTMVEQMTKVEITGQCSRVTKFEIAIKSTGTK